MQTLCSLEDAILKKCDDCRQHGPMLCEVFVKKAFEAMSRQDTILSIAYTCFEKSNAHWNTAISPGTFGSDLVLNHTAGNALFPLYELFSRIHISFLMNLMNLLWVRVNSQQIHEQFLRTLVEFVRILYSFLRISDAVLKNYCMNSWRRIKNDLWTLRIHKNFQEQTMRSQEFLMIPSGSWGFHWMFLLTSSRILRTTAILSSFLLCPEQKKQHMNKILAC